MSAMNLTDTLALIAVALQAVSLAIQVSEWKRNRPQGEPRKR